MEKSENSWKILENAWTSETGFIPEFLFIPHFIPEFLFIPDFIQNFAIPSPDQPAYNLTWHYV